MRYPYLILLFVLGLAVVLSIAVGSVFIPPLTVLHLLGGGTLDGDSQPFAVILFQLRLPRTALVALTGAALGGSGAAYQGLFRNPLADPYLIGVASGGGLGAVAAMSIHWSNAFLGLLSIPIAAFVGALLTVLVVYLMARVGATAPTTNLILAGVAIGSFATALTSFLMLRAQGDLHRALAWLLGGATTSGWGAFLAALPYVVVGLGALLLLAYALNVLQFGDEQAHQMGLPVERMRLLIVLAASLSSAAAVSFSGIIGFVGLIVPHIIRLSWGPDHRRLLPLSMLGGAAMLLVADVIARVILSPQEIPVGIITALAGAPFFLWILRRAKQQAYW